MMNASIIIHTCKVTVIRNGCPVSVDLIPNGSSCRVTKENRLSYVDAYVDYELNKKVKEPYEAFAEGFRKVCDSDVFVSTYIWHNTNVYISRQCCSCIMMNLKYW